MYTKLITTGVQKIKTSCENNEVIFEIDFDHPEAKKTIKEMSMSWSDCPIDSAPFEEHLKYWLQIAGRASLGIYLQNDDFSAELLSKYECFYPMDGSYGIKISSWYFYIPDPFDYDISMVDIDYDVQ